MKLTIEGLANKKAWMEANVKLPTYDIHKVYEHTKSNPTWVHFGPGNIFRAFIGKLANQLISEKDMQGGITCVGSYDYTIIDSIYKEYDNLVLSVVLNENGETTKEVYASLGEALTSEQKNHNRLKEIFQTNGLQIVSFTITEKGYALSGSDGALFPWIESDIKAGPQQATSTIAVACSMLWYRFLENAKPIAMVSMDNCSHNGDILKASILEFAKRWRDLKMVSDEFICYLEDESKVSFPWTMIDKITPRPATSVYEELMALGIEDVAPRVTPLNTYIAPFVNAERTEYLVMEDNFPNGRPPLEKAGVYFSNRESVDNVERMKVTTCLNPLHTALAVYGCLLGYELISEEMKNPLLKELVLQIGPKEGMETVVDPKIISPKAFVDEVIHTRLPNPYMPDAPQRIATDTSQKVGIRFGATIKAYVEKYGDAKKLKAIPLAIAGWCRYLLGVDDLLQPMELSSDPMLEELCAILKGIEVGKPETYKGQLKPILSNASIFTIDLYEAGIGEMIEAFFMEEIKGKHAVEQTLKKHLQEEA